MVDRAMRTFAGSAENTHIASFFRGRFYASKERPRWHSCDSTANSTIESNRNRSGHALNKHALPRVGDEGTAVGDLPERSTFAASSTLQQWLLETGRVAPRASLLHLARGSYRRLGHRAIFIFNSIRRHPSVHEGYPRST